MSALPRSAAASEWIEYSVPNSAVEPADKIPAFILRHPSGSSSLTIAQHGATVVSWKILNQELLFVSNKSSFGPGKAIRGGIPIVFPQFGPGKLPQHGFARNRLWEHGETEINKSNGDISTSFILQNNTETELLWPHSFRLTMTITLKSTSFAQRLIIENTGNSESDQFSFTTLLHTYFAVSDHLITNTQLSGLKGLNYLDNCESNQEFLEGDNSIQFGNKEIDRVYIGGGKRELIISDDGNGELLLKCTGFNDIVTWNPWLERGKLMGDLGEENSKKFICVEAGSVNKEIHLLPGEKWEGIQGISLRINPGK